jgi:hypothetical protein
LTRSPLRGIVSAGRSLAQHRAVRAEAADRTYQVGHGPPFSGESGHPLQGVYAPTSLGVLRPCPTPRLRLGAVRPSSSRRASVPSARGARESALPEGAHRTSDTVGVPRTRRLHAARFFARTVGRRTRRAWASSEPNAPSLCAELRYRAAGRPRDAKAASVEAASACPYAFTPTEGSQRLVHRHRRQGAGLASTATNQRFRVLRRIALPIPSVLRAVPRPNGPSVPSTRPGHFPCAGIRSAGRGRGTFVLLLSASYSRVHDCPAHCPAAAPETTESRSQCGIPEVPPRGFEQDGTALGKAVLGSTSGVVTPYGRH